MSVAGRRVASRNPAPAATSKSARTPDTGGAGRAPAASCVICTVPRTGSWLLCEGLLATRLAGRPEEYLRPDWYASFREHGGLSYQHRLDFWPSGRPAEARVDDGQPLDYQKFLTAVRDVGTTNGIFAVKIHRNQLDNAVRRLRGIEPDLDDLAFLTSWLPAPRYVFLRRRDAVRRAVSHYRALHSGIWWRRHDVRRTTADPPIDPAAIHELLLRCARQEQAWIDLFRRAGVEPLTLFHEDFAGDLDLDRGVDAVLRHLGVDPARTPPRGPVRLTRQADAWTDRVVHEYITWSRRNVALDERHYGFDASA